MGHAKQVEKADKTAIMHLITTGMTQSHIVVIFHITALASKMWKKKKKKKNNNNNNNNNCLF